MHRSDAIKAKEDLHAKLTKDLDPKLQPVVRRAWVGVGVFPESTSDFSVQVWVSQDDASFRALCQKFVSTTPAVKLKYTLAQSASVPDPIPASSKRTTKRYYQRLPIFPGVSIGNAQGSTATLGCIVKKDGEMFLLSSSSGIVPASLPEGGTVGICQPGLVDGGHVPDVIADLKQWTVPNPLEPNPLDAAIAQVLPKAKRLIKDTLDEQIPFGGTGEARVGTAIQKYGRTTGWTVGKVVDVSFNGLVHMGGRSFRFVNQIVVQGYNERKKPVDFIQGGDVGSALVHLDAGRATLVGLVIASMAGGYALANPIPAVFEYFGVTL